MQFDLAGFDIEGLAFSTDPATGQPAVTVDQFVQTLLGGLAIGCIYSLIALGISMIIRATEILHFGQGEMLMIGSLMGLSAFWLHELPFVVVLLFGIVGGGIISTVTEFTVYRTLRTRRVALINIVIATLGMSLLFQNLARLIWGSE